MHSRCSGCGSLLPDRSRSDRTYCGAVCRSRARHQRVARDAGLGHELRQRAEDDPRAAALLAELA
jgi:hypothetical protein